METQLRSCVNTHSENEGMKVIAKKVEKGKEIQENLKCGVDLDLKQERRGDEGTPWKVMV